MSRPLLLITLGLILGTAAGHIIFYEWNLGHQAAGSIAFLLGGMVIVALTAFATHLYASRSLRKAHPSTFPPRKGGGLFPVLTFLFFTLLGTLRYAHFAAQEWPSWTQMKAQLDRPINRGNPDEFDYEQWLWLQQKRIAADGWTIVDRPGPLDSLRKQALHVRERLIQRYADAGLEGDTLALIAAMTLGDRSSVSRTTRDLYADAGASHLLALSGLHLGIILGLLSWLFGGTRLRWSRWRLPAVLLMLLFIWAFAFVAGLPTSLIRAALMSTVFLLALLLQRDSNGVNNLMLAIVVMLLLRPTYLLDVGAQLSVMSVLGICLFYGPVWHWFIETHPRAHAWLKRHYLSAPLQLLLVSFSAQLLTMPLVGHYFHQIAPWGTLFSLIYIPVTTLVIYGALLLLIVPSALLAQAISLLIGVQGWFMQVEQQLPLATIPDFWSAKAQPGIVVYNNPRCPAVHLIASPSNSWVLVSDSARLSPDEGLRYIASSFWAKRFYTPPTLRSGQHTLQGAGMSVVLLDTDLRHNSSPSASHPATVDVLVIARGFRGSLYDVAKSILPRRIVLDASLRPWQVECLKAEAAVLGWPVWDIRRQGALYWTSPY